MKKTSSKKILYISISSKNGAPGFIRFIAIKNHLENIAQVSIVNLPYKSKWNYYKYRFFDYYYRRIIKKELLPDSDVLMLPKYKKRIKNIINREQVDIALISVPPFSFLHLPKFIKELKNSIKVVVDLGDPVSANLNFKRFSKNKQQYLLMLEEESLTHADNLIVLNEEIKKYYQSLNYQKPVLVIEQGIDESFVELENNTSRHIDKVILTYAGYFYHGGREPFELYKAIDLINDGARLNVYGQFNKVFKPPPTPKYFYGGKVTREELSNIYKHTDVVVFIDNKDSLQVPGKTLEVLALNKPVLFIYHNDDSPTIKYMKHQKGVYLSKNKHKDIAFAVQRIICDNIYHVPRDMSDFYWSNILKRLCCFV